MMTNTIERVSRILEGLTKHRLEFQKADQIVASEWNRMGLIKAQGFASDRPSFIESLSGGNVGFPVYKDNSFNGLAIVRGLMEKSASSTSELCEITELAGLLTALINKQIQAEEHKMGLASLEDNLRAQLELMEQKQPILSRFGRRVVLMKDRTSDYSYEEYSDYYDGGYSDSYAETNNHHDHYDDGTSHQPSHRSLLIEHPAHFKVEHLAIEIHQNSERWAFLALENLDPSTLDTLENLQSLGAVTVFIRNIHNLSSQQQQQILNYLRTQPGADLPRFVAGSPIDQGTAESALLAELKNAFLTISLTEPSFNVSIAKALDFVLDSMTDGMKVQDLSVQSRTEPGTPAPLIHLADHRIH